MALVRKSEWILLLRAETMDAFNRRAQQATPELVNADLRMLDLRRADLKHANLRGAYLRDVDLRGVDLSEADLEGASLHRAQISGVLFPRNLSAEEIRLSSSKGTRLRLTL